jgi:hypothetical protein
MNTDSYFKIDDDGNGIFIITDGSNVIYRDSLDAQLVEGKTLTELQELSQQRYDDHIDFLEQAAIAAQQELIEIQLRDATLGSLLPDQPVIGE